MPNLGIKKWESIVELFYDKYKGLYKWQNDNYATVCKQGFLVNPTGRILTFHKHKEKEGVFSYSRPEVCNYPVQSLATADIVPLVMVIVSRRLQKAGLYKVKLINQVHDSILLDAPTKDVDQSCKIVINTFRDIPKLVEQYFGFKYNVPMDGDAKVNMSWGNLTKWKGDLM